MPNSDNRPIQATDKDGVFKPDSHVNLNCGATVNVSVAKIPTARTDQPPTGYPDPDLPFTSLADMLDEIARENRIRLRIAGGGQCKATPTPLSCQSCPST